MATLRTASDGRCLRLPGRAAREILAGASGALAVTMRHVEIGPDDGSPPRGPHVHRDFEECIYVLEGTGSTETETGTFAVGPGDTLLIPPGELHVTRNTGSGPLKLLCFFPVPEIGPGTREFASWDAARLAS